MSIKGKTILGGMIAIVFVIMLIGLIIDFINDKDAKGFWVGIICVIHFCGIIALPILLS